MSTHRSARLLALATLVPLAFAAPLRAQQTPPDCTSADHRAFDFWVGTWDVFNPGGTLVAENIITLEMNDCVVHESYTNTQGYHGESFNVFDRSRGVWHQTWVDQNGALLQLEGGIVDGSMVLEGTTVGPGGTEVLNRVAWTPNADGSVRQHWQSTRDGGATWSTAFDGTYRRR
jgi:hypothetical protein